MRKLVYGINLSLDGVVAHDKLLGGKDVHEFFTNVLREADTLIYGRITYELMVPFWPDMAKNHSGDKSMDDFADAFAAVKNIVVFSRSKGLDLKEEILRLKKEPGKDMLVGGVDIPTQLIQLGLIDEFLFMVQPVLAGKGRRLLDTVELPGLLELKQVDTKVFPSGCIAMRFVKG